MKWNSCAVSVNMVGKRAGLLVMFYRNADLPFIGDLVGTFGNNSLSALGLMSVEVTRKKINNRKTMSVIEAMVKPA